MRFRMSLVCVALLLLAGRAVGDVVDFEDLSLSPPGYVNNVPGGEFTSGAAKFNSYYDTQWGSWEGWGYSNNANIVDGSWGNQFSVYDANNGANQFGLAYTSPFALEDTRIELPEGVNPVSVQVANTTYAALTMANGDEFGYSRKFGKPPEGETSVPDGQWPDWFKLVITGLDADDQPVGGPVEFYLADYRNINGAPDYIVDEWTGLDLSSLSGARYLVFSHQGSDVGTNGLNTPAYVAIDNLTFAAVPEPSALVLGVLGLLGAMIIRRHCR